MNSIDHIIDGLKALKANDDELAQKLVETIKMANSNLAQQDQYNKAFYDQIQVMRRAIEDIATAVGDKEKRIRELESQYAEKTLLGT